MEPGDKYLVGFVLFGFAAFLVAAGGLLLTSRMENDVVIECLKSPDREWIGGECRRAK